MVRALIMEPSMAEANTAELEAKADAAFSVGFGDTPPAPVKKVVEEAAPEAAKPGAVVTPIPPRPEYVRLTKQEWDNAKAAAGKVSSLESQVAKLVGSMPKSEQIVQQVLDNVRSQTPAGTEIDPQVLVDAFAEQAIDFPELAGQNRKAIEHVFKNMRGLASAQSPASPVDMNAEVEKVLLIREGKALNRAHPDWSEIVGRPLTDGDTPVMNDFRHWLARQPADYQKEISETDSPAEVRAAIDKFKATPKTATPARSDRAAARRAVIEDAVTPRADGTPPPLNPLISADEAFSSGFKSIRRQ